MRDQDKKLLILTEDMGLIEAIARKVNGARSALSAAAEVLAYSDFCLYAGKGGYIVNSADLLQNFYDLRMDLTKLSLASYFCELTRFILPDRDNGGSCLKLLLNTLWLLEKGKRSPSLLKAVYELRLLTLSGFAPDFSGCVRCGEENNLIFFPLDGTLLCTECVGSMPPDRPRMPLPQPVFLAMRYICEAPDEKLFSFRLNPDSEKALGIATEYFTLCQTAGQFKSLDFYKTLPE
jgi:DNA repair protein RecO (recombination protein O)